MARRYAKWFVISPLGTSSGPAQATYKGVDQYGNRDPIGQGQIGTTYPVMMYSLTKLEAPNPPFSTGEGFSVPQANISLAVEKQLSRRKAKPGKPLKKAKKTTKTKK